MPRYTIRSFNPASGQVDTCELDAASATQAASLIEQQGKVLLGCQEGRWRLGWRKGPRADVILFCEELATLLRAGLSLVEALDALAHRGHASDAPLYQALLESLQKGQALSQAMQAIADVFPPLLIASLRSAERTGQIDETLRQFAQLMRSLQEVRRKLLSSAIYPSLVIAFGGAVGLFLLFFIIPRFASVYSGLGTAPSPVSQILMLLSQHMAHYRSIWLMGLLGLMATAAFLWRAGTIKHLLIMTAGRIGWIRYWFRLFQMAEVYRSMAMMLRGGFNLLETLELCRHTPAEAFLRVRLSTLTRQVEEGMPVSQALAGAEIADAIALRLLIAGERAGELPAVLDAIADDHDRRISRFLERSMKLAEPLIMILVGALIGTLVLLMYMPIFDLAGSLNLS